MLDSLLLRSNEKPKNYTQYSGSRKGSDIQSNVDSKNAECSNNDDEETKLQEMGLVFATESGDSASGPDELYIQKQNSYLVEQVISSSNKNSTNLMVHSDSGLVFYKNKGSSSDVLNPRSQFSGVVSRRTTSQNR